ncbi:hypothetical protein TNCV_987841 [Trichonephila clavipes]|nr:hypothetical protein TNCV_987841 [Trichonephila clavipes]
MWMDAFRATGNVSKERKGLHRPLERLKLWNEFVCQFLPALQEKNLDNVWLQQNGNAAHTSRFSWVS